MYGEKLGSLGKEALRPCPASPVAQPFPLILHENSFYKILTCEYVSFPLWICHTKGYWTDELSLEFLFR